MAVTERGKKIGRADEKSTTRYGSLPATAVKND